ncbi:MAG TPA: potassium transporter [Planctomycetes bacterium]|nr:potassium transporter [Planctomycetota bacterium]
MANFRQVFNLLGLLILGLGGMLAAAAACSAVMMMRGREAEHGAFWGLLIAAGASIALGGVLWRATRAQFGMLGRREAFVVVAAAWVVGALIGGLPYFVWAWMSPGQEHAFRNPVNCYFEAMSGFTTTGASVLDDVQSIPSGLLLWRAATQWLGGLGIIVLFVAVLPMLGAGGKRLFSLEAPGPAPEGVRPHIRETARVLWLIYLGMTLVESVALRIAGLPWLEAVCQTFTTVATGGFGTRTASIGGFQSVAVEVIVIVFMVLAGVNFALYYDAIRGRRRSVWRNTELRVYLALLACAAAAVAIALVFAGRPLALLGGGEAPATWGNAARHGIFAVVSIQTTTGFATSDFDLWPFFARGILIALMFVGGSAGATAGGLKVVRIIICCKVIVAEIERAFRPNVVRPVKVNRTAIDHGMKLETLAYVLIMFAMFLGGAALVALCEPASSGCNFVDAGTASASALFNIGPGLGLVGPAKHYGWMTDASKLVLSLLMAVGRLEFFPFAVLFMPRFWKAA